MSKFPSAAGIPLTLATRASCGLLASGSIAKTVQLSAPPWRSARSPSVQDGRPSTPAFCPGTASGAALGTLLGDVAAGPPPRVWRPTCGSELPLVSFPPPQALPFLTDLSGAASRRSFGTWQAGGQLGVSHVVAAAHTPEEPDRRVRRRDAGRTRPGLGGPATAPEDLLPTEPGWRAEAAQLRAVAGRSGSLAVAAGIASAKVTGGVLGTAVRTANTNPWAERTTPPASSRKPTDPHNAFPESLPDWAPAPARTGRGPPPTLF